MFVDQDHFLGHLLAAALELMLGEKVLITHAGGCPYGFYAEVYPAFPLGEGYFVPLQDHMKNFISTKQPKLLLMERQNGVAFLRSLGKKRLAQHLQGGEESALQLIQLGNYVAHYPYTGELLVTEEFVLDKLEPLERGGFCIYGRRLSQESRKNFHLDHLPELGKFFGKDFLWNGQGVEVRKNFIEAFKACAQEEGLVFICTGPWGKESYHRFRELGLSWSAQWVTTKYFGVEGRFAGLKGVPEMTMDRFFYFNPPEKVEEAFSSCLRLIEKWIKILGIRGNFTERDRWKISWEVQDPFGALFKGPYIERHASGCLTGSLMGPLELMIAVHAEEKSTWNLENRESMNRSVSPKSV